MNHINGYESKYGPTAIFSKCCCENNLKYLNIISRFLLLLIITWGVNNNNRTHGPWFQSKLDSELLYLCSWLIRSILVSLAVSGIVSFTSKDHSYAIDFDGNRLSLFLSLSLLWNRLMTRRAAELSSSQVRIMTPQGTLLVSQRETETVLQSVYVRMSIVRCYLSTCIRT